MTNLNYKETLKEIQSRLNNELNVKERMELVNKFLDYGVKVEFDYNEYGFVFTYSDEELKEIHLESILEYISSPIFIKQNGRKKKIHPLYENTYLAIGLSNISDYVLYKWHEWENNNHLLDDYTIQSKYDLARLASAGSKKSIVGFDTSVADDFLENSVSKTVMQGWEFHVDQLEKHTRQTDDIFRLSEDTKREIRNNLIIKNLEKYPTLKERYIAYKEMGIRYGFDKELSPEQKAEMKQKWIEHFSKEKNHPVKPKDRYYRLLQMYNNIGYELSVVQQQLASVVQPKPNKQPLKQVQTVEDYAGAFVLKMVKLDIPEHINGLLTIQKGIKVGEYHPLYIMLKQKYKTDDEPVFNLLESEFNEVLEVADLTDMERDIVNLIIGKHQEFNIYVQGNKNPYEYIALYINEKYQQKKTKTNIMRMVEKGISKVIANTYQDLENGLDIKKCTSCRVEKMASENNFGKDTRKKDGLKSICKKCTAKKVKIKREIV
jgi:hypothetical protein